MNNKRETGAGTTEAGLKKETALYITCYKSCRFKDWFVNIYKMSLIQFCYHVCVANNQ